LHQGFSDDPRCGRLPRTNAHVGAHKAAPVDSTAPLDYGSAYPRPRAAKRRPALLGVRRDCPSVPVAHPAPRLRSRFARRVCKAPSAKPECRARSNPAVGSGSRPGVDLCRT